MLTDNPVLVRKHRKLPVLMCGQNKGNKVVPTEQDLINATIASFGCDVGRITNRCTSMYDVQSGFKPDSKEYSVLAYRICCSQQAQQDSIKNRWLHTAMCE